VCKEARTRAVAETSLHFAHVCLFFACLIYATCASSDSTTYRYEGNNFTFISFSDPPLGDYTVDMSVSGTFTVSEPLEPMPLSDISADVLSFTFFDGRRTLTKDSATNFFQFYIGVSPEGEIDQWWIGMGSDLPTAPGEQLHQIYTSFDTVSGDPRVFDQGQVAECVSDPECLQLSGDQGSVIGSPGTWSIVTEIAPDQDSDGDGLFDTEDNCTAVANGPDLTDLGGNSQLDTDGDGFGNYCDADFNNDGTVNFVDLAELKAAFGTAEANVDMDGNGFVNFGDLAIFKAGFGKPPGPSGVVP